MPTRLCRVCGIATEVEELRKDVCPFCYLLDGEREFDEDEPLAVDEMMQKHRRKWK